MGQMFTDRNGRRYRVKPGRKRGAEPAANRFFVIRLTDEQKRQLQAIADQNLTTRTKFCQDAIDAAIAECSERAGLFSRSRVTETRP